MRASKHLVVCMLALAALESVMWFPAVSAEPSSLKHHSPIVILGDAGFLAPPETSGVLAGSGASNDPYIIEGWNIDASKSQGTQIVANLVIKAGIIVSTTTKSFVIRNVWVHSGGEEASGILLHRVSSGEVRNSLLADNRRGVSVGDSPLEGAPVGGGIVLAHNQVERNGIGIAMGGSGPGASRLIGGVIVNNVISDNSAGVFLDGDGVTVSGNKFLGGNVAISGFTSESSIVRNIIMGPVTGIRLLSDSAENLISGNIIMNSLSVGIHIFEGFNDTITGNILHGAATGIYLFISWDNNVTRNIVSDIDRYGILVLSSGRDRIDGNMVKHTPRGVWTLQPIGQIWVVGNTVVDSEYPIAYCGNAAYMSFDGNRLVNVDNPITSVTLPGRFGCGEPIPSPEP